jgi:hypothetical protein
MWKSVVSALALGASCVLAACSSDDGDATSPTTVDPSIDVDGGSASDDATSYPPLPPYVVDNTPLSPDYSIFDHGKDCYDRFQVEVPSFDCDGPDSSRLKIEVNGAEVTTSAPSKCDKPSLVGTNYACVPGARVTKLQTVNKYGHTIATVIACRRSTVSALDSGKFDNIAVLQSDLQNNESCWYQIRASSSFVGRNIPAPYAAGRKKGDAADKKAVAAYESPITLTTDHSECFRCHDNQVFLSTPWISTKNQTPSLSGNVNEIPRPGGGEPTFLGKAYRGWNLPSARPKQIKIDKAAFDKAVPPTAAQQSAMQAGTMAPSDACTSCHTIAKSDLATAGQGTCNHFARYWMSSQPTSFNSVVLGSKLSSYGDSFPRNAWMPPSAPSTFTSDAAYQGFYARAFKAIEVCCEDPSRAGCKP